jgi:hypothetical protein
MKHEAIHSLTKMEEHARQSSVYAADGRAGRKAHRNSSLRGEDNFLFDIDEEREGMLVGKWPGGGLFNLPPSLEQYSATCVDRFRYPAQLLIRTYPSLGAAHSPGQTTTTGPLGTMLPPIGSCVT